MSYSTILGITLGKDFKYIEELKNSHGTAPVIWDILCQELYNSDPFAYHGIIDKLWPRWQDLSISKYKRAVLMMTFDLAYVKRENFNRAAADIRKFIEEYPPLSGYVNHWGKIAEIYESNPDYDAIGIYQTSVTDNPFQGTFNEETQEYNTIDWGQTYEIYDELDAIKNLNE